MSPDDVSILKTELKATTHELSEIKVAMHVLITEFRAHQQAEVVALEIREKTCPHLSVMQRIKTDSDALAGIVRTSSLRMDVIEGRLGGLEEWQDIEKVGEAIDGAQRTVIYTPVKWTLKNLEKILLALVLAWMIFRFGP